MRVQNDKMSFDTAGAKAVMGRFVGGYQEANVSILQLEVLSRSLRPHLSTRLISHHITFSYDAGAPGSATPGAVGPARTPRFTLGS